MFDGRGVMRRCTARFAVERAREVIVVWSVVGCAVRIKLHPLVFFDAPMADGHVPLHETLGGFCLGLAGLGRKTDICFEHDTNRCNQFTTFPVGSLYDLANHSMISEIIKLLVARFCRHVETRQPSSEL
jgi:hypothetical protein